MGTRQASLSALGAEHAAQIRTTGEQSAETARSTLASGSAQARSEQGAGGGGEAGQGRAHVATRLGGDAAAQFEGAASEVGGPLRAHATEAADVVDQQAARAASVMGGHAAALQEQIGATATGAGTELSGAANTAIADLRTGDSRARQAIDAVETDVVDRIQSRAGEHREQIQAAGTEAADKIRERSEGAVGAATRQLERVAGQLADARIGEQAALEAAEPVQAHIVSAFSAAAEDAHKTGSQIANHLTTAGQQVTGALRQAPVQTRPGMSWPRLPCNPTSHAPAGKRRRR